MRRLASLNNHDDTKRFIDYLLVQGIRTRAEEVVETGEWVVWIIEDDQVDQAKAELERFLTDPHHERYAGHARAANQVRVDRRKRAAQAKRNLRDVRTSQPIVMRHMPHQIPITMGLIAICVLVALLTGLGMTDAGREDPLMFVSDQHLNDASWDPADPWQAMIDIRGGEIWRLVTPALVHLGVLHLVFNMMWLHDLGGQIEMRKGKPKYILLLLALALLSNLVQVWIAKHPFFGGMSGVVYGLFGYVWIKSRFDPQDRFFISQRTVNLMMIWFVFCFYLGGIANGAHAGGLVVGAAIGFISARMR